MIIDVLYNDSPASADELACTSSFYYHLTRYRQYREVCVAISTTTNEVAFQNRLVVVEKEGLLPAIRRVRVRIGAIDKQKCTTTMIEFIGKMMTLADLEWRYAKNIKMSTCVPNQLISLLQSRPQVRLHAGVSPPSVLHPRSEHDLEYNLYRLEGLKNLSSFQVRFTYRKSKICDFISPCVKHMLMSCPNLRKLTIDIKRRAWAHDRLSEHYAGFGFMDGERLPALEELNLVNYKFGHAEDGELPWPWERCIGYPGSGDEIIYWAETFDWSILRRLHLHQVTLTKELAPKLVSLQEVSVYGYEAQRFFQSLPVGLSTIRVGDIFMIGLEALVRHGRCLKTLDLQSHYYHCYNPPQYISSSWLLIIQQECPHIRDLAIDVGRDGEWPYERLDILAGFPQLQNLTIRLDSGRPNGRPNKIRQPYVTYSAVCHLFSYLLSQRSSAMKPLRQLTINTGLFHDWDTPTLREWARDIAITFSCRVSGAGGGDNSNGSLNVRCQHLSDEENQQLATSTPGSNASIGSNRRLRIAQQGPVACEWHDPS
jgi:hypothetical protein